MDFFCVCSVDRDNDGGYCTNFKAILSLEVERSQTSPDIWVNRNTFNNNNNWAVASGRGNCNLKSSGTDAAVYACR